MCRSTMSGVEKQIGLNEQRGVSCRHGLATLDTFTIDS